ncbi:MAG: LacI family transcriptional regulator [Lachnospiraceae bacterium]|nr:LacI family transcriptional regulator [Lachnospiraceae bacterium]
MVSMKDISKACGVSIATVSKALNDHHDISQETKDKVRATARELGYHPNSSARALKTNRTYNIGILFRDDMDDGLVHDFFSGILNSFKAAAEAEGYDITFLNNSKTGKNRMSYLQRSRYRGFDGVAIICVDFSNPEVLELVQSEIPVVTIDYIFNNRTAIVSDNAKGMRDLLHFIYKKGHRKIAYIHGAPSAVTQTRLSSFFKTAQELNLEIPDEYLKEAAYRSTDEAEKRTAELLNLPDPPTCILYPDDFACYGGINKIREMGLSVPEDISVAGYDGIRMGRHIEPKLTTIRQDANLMGKVAAEKLIAQIDSPKTTLIEQVVIEGEVYEGKSVKDLK